MNRRNAFRILLLALAAFSLFYIGGLHAELKQAGFQIAELRLKVSNGQRERSLLEARIEAAEAKIGAAEAQIEDLESYSHYH